MLLEAAQLSLVVPPSFSIERREQRAEVIDESSVSIVPAIAVTAAPQKKFAFF